MGDAGSLSLGATLAVIALITGQILVLPLIGLIFVVETMSDIIQIGYFKLSGGKRCSGWRRSTTTSSWAAGTRRRSRSGSGSSGILAGLLGVTLFLASINALQLTMTRAGRPRRAHARRRARRAHSTAGR